MFGIGPNPYFLLMSDEERAEWIAEDEAHYTPLLPNGAGGMKIPKCHLFGEQAILTLNNEVRFL